MKKTLPAILFLMALSITLFSQPTITSANMYAPGDELLIQPADTTGVVPGPLGANQTWDFTGITNDGALTTQTVVLASATPYASSFTGSDLAIDAGGGNYGYFDINGDDLIQTGFASTSIVAPYSDPQKFISYPFTYTTSFTDDFSGTFEINGYENNRSGTVNFLVDGYGTLLLPGKTYTDVLRIQYIQNITDVLHFGPITLTSITASTTYIWMTEGNKNALMDISYISSTVSGNTINTKSVYYYPGATSTENIMVKENSIQLFPNPASDVINVGANLKKAGEVEVTLFNSIGQRVKQIVAGEVPAGNFSTEIDLHDLSSGNYFLKLDQDGVNLETKSIVKQ